MFPADGEIEVDRDTFVLGYRQDTASRSSPHPNRKQRNGRSKQPNEQCGIVRVKDVTGAGLGRPTCVVERLARVGQKWREPSNRGGSG